jgi:flagellar hook-associated protein 1 FlgK
MGSTLGSLQTAYSGLSAAQLGIDVTGQNTANAMTPGYIRQKVTTEPVGAPGQVGPAPTGLAAGQGVRVTGIVQLGSTLLDAQVWRSNAAAADSGVRAAALTQIQTTLGEPSADAISGNLQGFWAAWQDVANQPGDQAPASALIGRADTLVQQISSAYRGVQQQWNTTHQDLTTTVDQVNAAAAGVADLNATIRSLIDAGGSADELIVQRNNLVSRLATLAGATVTANPDNTINVSIGGTNIVQDTSARALQVAGPGALDDIEPAVGPDGEARIVWKDSPSVTVSVHEGRIGGDLSVLAPASGGGVIATTARDLNTLADTLATQVNGIATTSQTFTGTASGPFFTIGNPATQSAALTLSVAVTGASELPTTQGGQAIGSAADEIAQLGTAAGSPDAGWAATVVALGTRTQTANNQSDLDIATQTAATQAQASQESVDLDEETVNLVAYQHAYQANARVLTTLDSVFDQLINHTGLVGLT